ncbi:MAG: hypothetical protein ACRDF4_06755 [Rhabdochlamydiaceae bacterium]
MKQIDRIADLKLKSAIPPELDVWKAQTERVLSAVFGPKSAQLDQFTKVRYAPAFLEWVNLNPLSMSLIRGALFKYS